MLPNERNKPAQQTINFWFGENVVYTIFFANVFSFWILIAPDMIYLPHIVIIWEKILPISGHRS